MTPETGGDAPCWAHLLSGEGGAVVHDLGTVDITGRPGAVWSLRHGDDLDVNLVRLHAGDAIGRHINNEVDVLVFVQSGSGTLLVDDQPFDLADDTIALIRRGCARSLLAGLGGITYLSIHRRRRALGVGSPPSGGATDGG